MAILPEYLNCQMLNLLFDFDGTLINSKPRLYFLFQELVTESFLSFDEYWQLKKNRVGHNEILANKFNYSERRILSFIQKWNSEIEQPSWLRFDQPFPKIDELLLDLYGKHHLYLVTNRQSELSVLSQLEYFGWKSYFKKILVTGQKYSKVEMVRGLIDLKPIDWMVGDTGRDILDGKELGLKTAAVLTGFLSEEKLKEYNPSIMLNSAIDIIEYL